MSLMKVKEKWDGATGLLFGHILDLVCLWEGHIRTGMGIWKLDFSAEKKKKGII